MAEEQDKSTKTEQPSEHKLRKAKEEGKIFTSRELNAFFSLLTLAIMIPYLMPKICKDSMSIFSKYISGSYQVIGNSQTIMQLFIDLLYNVMPVILLPLLIIMIVGILGFIIQRGPIYSASAIKPDLSKLSPIKGLKRIFSKNSVFELIKGIAKISLMGITIYFVIEPEFKKFNNSYIMEFNGVLSLLLHLINKMMIAVCVIMFFLGITDYIYQKHSYIISMMMTRAEVKEEHKHHEGSPEIKSKLKSLRMKRAKKRMMAAVPKADVVITNPTHYAVALEYDPDDMPAPMLIAKGKNAIAIEIKRVAKENGVPIVENPELARMLYKSVELDQYIKPEHYAAVAKIIHYISNLSNKYDSLVRKRL